MRIRENAIGPETEGPIWIEADLNSWIALHARVKDREDRADLIA